MGHNVKVQGVAKRHANTLDNKRSVRALFVDFRNDDDADDDDDDDDDDERMCFNVA